MIAHLLQSVIETANAVAGDSNSIDWISVAKWVGSAVGAFLGTLLAVKKYGNSILKAILEKVTNVDDAVNHGRMERLEAGHNELKLNQEGISASIGKLSESVTRLEVVAEHAAVARQVDLTHRSTLDAKLDLLLQVHGVQHS